MAWTPAAGSTITPNGGRTLRLGHLFFTANLLEELQATLQPWGLISGSILAVLALTAWIYGKVMKPMWRGARRAYRRGNQAVDEILGDKPKGIPSMVERMTALEEAQAEQRYGDPAKGVPSLMEQLRIMHREWHVADLGSATGPPVPQPPNGGTPPEHAHSTTTGRDRS